MLEKNTDNPSEESITEDPEEQPIKEEPITEKP